MCRTEVRRSGCPIRPAALLLALFPVAAFAAPASAQANPNNENNLALNNASDVVFIYSDPSVGATTGTFPPDFNGDLFWKVYPKETLLSPSGTLEISGFRIWVDDTDWQTPSSFYDLMFTRGKPSATSPGSIEPDFSDPNAVFLSLGPTGIPDPCVISPALCTSGGCPPVGYVSGWNIDAQIGSCAGDGIIINSDGTTDLVMTAFLPGGMTFMSGPPGPCGIGDYVFQDAHSTDETQADWLGNGKSAYGGHQVAGSAIGLTAEPRTETSAIQVQFCEPMLSVRGSLMTLVPGLPLPGLEGVELSIGSGSPFGYVVFDEDGIGDTCFAASSLFPPVPAPGFSLFGARILLDPTDPLVLHTLEGGSVKLVPHGGVPFDDGMYFGPPSQHIPPTAAGFSVYSQALTIDLATLTSRSTQVTRTRLHP